MRRQLLKRVHKKAEALHATRIQQRTAHQCRLARWRQLCAAHLRLVLQPKLQRQICERPPALATGLDRRQRHRFRMRLLPGRLAQSLTPRRGEAHRQRRISMACKHRAETPPLLHIIRPRPHAAQFLQQTAARLLRQPLQCREQIFILTRRDGSLL